MVYTKTHTHTRGKRNREIKECSSFLLINTSTDIIQNWNLTSDLLWRVTKE